MAQNLPQKLGEQIRMLRKERGWSQEGFAQHLKLHRTYVGAIERGEKNVTIKNLEKIALKLEVKISDLFEAIGY